MTTNQQADRLLPCPFCGSDKISEDFGDESGCVRCRNCGCQSGRVFFTEAEKESDDFTQSEADAIEAWNRRATLARTPSVPDDVAADAARYRWLRAQVQSGPLTIAKSDPWELQPWSGDDPDGRIDAARASHEGEQP